jgi:serine phosphatase RsbU (regulator of sigma subunit)/putative methionine-R-sulfoxide reductase with GAF domain
MPPEPASKSQLGGSELAVLGEIGRAILEAQLDEDQLCKLIYVLAGRVVPTPGFQLGLLDGDRYQIKILVRDGERQPPAVYVLSPGQGIVGWLREHRRAILVHDFEAELDDLPFRPTYHSARPPRSAIFLPLLVADSIIGLISIQSPQPGAFTEDDVRVLTILANQSASALNNARLYRRGQRRLNDLAAIAEVGRKINSILDVDELLSQVVELIQTHFGYYHVQIFLVPKDSDRAYFKASSGHHGLNERWQREGRSLRIGQEGIVGWVAQHGALLLAGDVTQEPRYIPDDPRALPDTRAEIAVPLVVERAVVGVLDVQSRQLAAFGDDDVFVLRTLADQVAVAISSARAYEAQREEAWLTTVMLQVAEATSQADGVAEVLAAAVRVTAMLAGVDSCTIWLWDEDLSCFQYGASFGLADLSHVTGAGPSPLFWKLANAQLAGDLEPLGEPPDGAADQTLPKALDGSPASSQFDAARENGYDGLWGDLPPRPASLAEALRFLVGDWPALDRLREAKTPAVISLDNIFLPRTLQSICPGDTMALLPMLNKGQVFGVLGVSFTHDRAPSLNERRLAMLAGIAHQVAAAVDNSRLAAALAEEAWISAVLLQVAEAMSRLQPLDTILAQVAHITPLLAGVDRCAVLLREEDGMFTVRQVHATRPGLADPYQGAIVRPGDLPLLDDACRLGQPLVVNDTERNPRVPSAWLQRYASRTVLAVPLLAADEVIGALIADDVDSTHKFSPRRVRILSGIASQAVVAIENARLQAQETANVRLLHELELSHIIQRSLLPQASPQIPGYQVVYRWRSAREVSGDFFDFIPLPSGATGIVVADVSDKGIPAAMYMMFARTLLRSIAFTGRSPAAVLERTNELIVTDSAADMFVTAYYSVLDTDQHALTYASAGHNLALFAPAHDPIQPITTHGLALGILTPAHIQQKTVDLGPGDIVLFYTDGVTDARNSGGESFSDRRLAAVLTAHRDAPAEIIADAIDAAVHDFVGPSAQYDDVTLVLLKRDEA